MSRPPARALPASTSRSTSLAIALLAIATFACYFNSFSGALVFDDRTTIRDNLSIASLWDMSRLGSMRGLVDESFAINYALRRFDVWGYHVVNLAIHFVTGLLLFGLVRRTLRTPKLADRFGLSADLIALATALLWLVHPLATQAVTYITQRYESAAAMFYLMALYAFCRAMRPGANSIRWFCAVGLAFALGLRSKETAITLPVVLMWYDRAFFADSWSDLWRRKSLYLALALIAVLEAGSTLLPMLSALSGTAPEPQPGNTPEPAVVVEGMTPWTYFLSQPAVLLHYLRLCVWPVGLCLDYGWPIAREARDIVPGLVVVTALLAVTVWAIFRYPRAAFVAGAFFLFLAPTSSVLPIQDVMVEHRMYLPLAAVILLIVLAAVQLWRAIEVRWPLATAFSRKWRPAVVILTIASAALGSLTYLRNRDYRSARIMYENICAQRPDFWRAHSGLAAALVSEGQLVDAEREITRTIELNPQRADAWLLRGDIRNRTDRLLPALADIEHSIELDPYHAVAFYHRGGVHFRLKHYAEAVADCTRALELEPRFLDAFWGRAEALQRLGECDRALADCEAAIRLQPRLPESYQVRAKVYLRCGQLPKAWQDMTTSRKLGGSLPPQFVAEWERAVSKQERSGADNP